MKSKLHIWIIIISVCAICLPIGGYMGFRLANDFYSEAIYADVNAEMVFDLSLLNLLRKKEGEENAIRLLESRMDTNIILINPEINLSDARITRIQKTLEDVSEYRDKYNVVNGDFEVEKKIQEIIKK